MRTQIRLEQYLNRIYSLIFSRRDVNVEELLIANQSQIDDGEVIPAAPPNLSEILQEIDSILY
jgi:hypothetical protein